MSVHPNSLKNLEKNMGKGGFMAKSPEEFKEIHARAASMGGKAKKERQTAREILAQILQKEMTPEEAKKYLGHYPEIATKYGVMLEKVADRVLKDGDVRSMEFIRDTVGDKPSDSIEVTANMITDKDRELLNLLAEGDETPEE